MMRDSSAEPRRRALRPLYAPALALGLSVLAPLSWAIEPCTGPEPCEVFVDGAFGPITPGWEVDHFDQIGPAIEAVGSGGVVNVASGTYEETLTLDKALTLEGENRDDTIIAASAAFPGVIELSADGIKVRGFTIESAGVRSSSGVRFSANNCLVQGNVIQGNVFGVQVLDSSNNQLADNLITQNSSDGIIIEGLSHENVVEHNLVESNGNIGCHIKGECEHNVIRENRLIANDYRGFCKRAPGTNNYIHRNSMIDNVDQDANDDGVNFWGRAYPAGGNYYSDYLGVDLFHGPRQDLPGGDGIGDTPYQVHADSTGTNVDQYPLMEPFVIDAAEPDPLSAPTGPTQGAPGQSLGFELAVTAASSVEVRWYWGEGEFSAWSGPFEDGDIVLASRIWLVSGDYPVHVQARDFDTGIESAWSEAAGVGIGLWGDASGDQVVDLSDAIYVLEYLFGDGPPPAPMFTADVNGDEILDVSDPVALLDYLF